MKKTFTVLLVLMSFQALCEESCPAPTYEELFDRKSVLMADKGIHPSHDYTNIRACVGDKATCSQQTWLNADNTNNFESHEIFYILCEDRVIFASTEEYYEMTYGMSFGSATAEQEWNEAYKNL